MRFVSAAVLALALLSGCALTRPYALRSAVNEAAFYRARYVDRCVTKRDVDVPCEAWALAQRRLDQAAGEAFDALKVGGSPRLQMSALRSHLEAVRKEFGSWAK